MTTLASIDAVAESVERLTAARHRSLIGIVGSPGAGKTTVGELLVERLGASAQLVSMDGFHLPQSRLVELGRRDRMGAPDTFDVDGFVALLTRLRAPGIEALAPGFDRGIEEPTPGTVIIPADIRAVVVEGNYLLVPDGGWERVGPLLDLTFFVAVDRDIRLSRLIARHELFGKSAAEARAWALGPDEANAQVIEPTVESADHVLRLPTRSV